ncbi:hypothetical protein SDC9_203003 [bioreactor metagenome]|uniref:Uncharacterized protein n=1 Tax=bioreactor metagenome TaxID=1076179 RepID=A0A645IVF9_9ZZZZ
MLGPDVCLVLLALLAGLDDVFGLVRANDDDAVRVPLQDVARVDQLTADDERVVDRPEGLLDGALDADGAREDGEAEHADVCAVADAGVGHERGEPLGLRGRGHDIAEGSGLRQLARGRDDDVARLCVGDGHLNHEVVAGVGANGHGGSTEAHGRVDGLDAV